MKISGLHINDWTDGLVEYIGETKPGWVKVLEQNRGNVERAMVLSPGTNWIGRMHRSIDAQKDYIKRQENGAERFFRDLTSQSLWPIVDTWEGINEPGPHPTVEYYRFEMRWVVLMRDAGKKPLTQGCSVGTWSGSESDPMHDDKSSWVHEVARAAKATGGGVHRHEYSAPHMRSEFVWNPAITERAGGFFTLRYRRAYAVMPEDARAPLYITECGIDSGISPPWNIPVQGGWRSFTTAEDYVEQLKWYIGCCKEDGYVRAVIPFCTFARDSTWYTYSMWDGNIRELWGEVLSEEEDGSDVPSGWVDLRESLLTTGEFITHPQSDFDEVIIHHSADEVNDVWDIANHHVANNGWWEIGYHVVIGIDGTIYWCHNFNVQAAHCKYQNEHTVGVCFIGNLNERWPTEAQLRSARDVLAHIPFDFTIKGHRDYRPTDCPGTTFDEWRHLLLEGGETPIDWEGRAREAEDKLERIGDIVAE